MQVVGIKLESLERSRDQMAHWFLPQSVIPEANTYQLIYTSTFSRVKSWVLALNESLRPTCLWPSSSSFSSLGLHPALDFCWGQWHLGQHHPFRFQAVKTQLLVIESVCNLEKRSKAHLSIMSLELTSVLPSTSRLLQNCLPLLYLGFLSCFTASSFSPTPNCHFQSDYLKIQLQVWLSAALNSSVSPYCLSSYLLINP